MGIRGRSRGRGGGRRLRVMGRGEVAAVGKEEEGVSRVIEGGGVTDLLE